MIFSRVNNQSLSPDGSMVIVNRQSDPRPLGPVEKFMARLGYKRRPSRPGSHFEPHLGIYDSATCKVIEDLPYANGCWLPGGRQFTAFDGGGELGEASEIYIFDFPPHQSRTWFACGAALIALPIALLAWRRNRKRRAA
jgi:hypothetical protein